MPEQGTHYRSYQPDNDAYDDDQTDHRVPSYRFGQSGRAGSDRDDSVPLFLSDADGAPDPREYLAPEYLTQEYLAPVRKIRRTSTSSRILAGVLAAAAAAILVALFTSDGMRDIIVSAKASIAAVLPSPSAAAQPDPTKLTASDISLKDPARLQAPANQTPGVRSVTTVAMAPTRADIASAYQNAVQGRAPAVAAPVALAPAAAPPIAASPVAASPARKLDAGELATLLNRAKGLLTAGDIPPARLLLERAADAQEAGAALLLAQTYDPDVLGTQDIRNITPDPAAARAWYQKAAQLGSADAQRRLSQLQN